MQTAEEFLDADLLRAATFVRHIEIHETLGSTNVRAAELARDPKIDLPALVVARIQTAGKGRGQNTWWSAEGALTFSVLLEPAAMEISTASWPQLSLATAVAVCDALATEIPPPLQGGVRGGSLGIKWPNDVMLDGRKVGGILIESPGGAAPAKDRLIIGIGINVNNSWRIAPRNSGANGAALCDITGRIHSLQQLLNDLLAAIKQRIIQLAADAPELPSAWQQLCYLTDEVITIATDSGTTTGRCLGIADDGALLLQTDIKTETLYSGSVSVRDKE